MKIGLIAAAGLLICSGLLMVLWDSPEEIAQPEPAGQVMASEPEPDRINPAIQQEVVPDEMLASSAPAAPLGVSKPVAEEDELPYFTKKEFVSASLEALEKNGSNLRLPMPSKHLIRCEDGDCVKRVTDWGRDNGFDIKPPKIFRGHGGVEFFDVELSRTEVPDAQRIQEQGSLIQSGIQDVAGAVYTTWVGEIVSR